MFNGCTSLTKAPALPATTLDFDCYYSMFNGCTSLTTAPTIKTYTSGLYAFVDMLNMLNVFDNDKGWGQLSSCNWPDLTLDEAKSMVLNDHIFGHGNSNINAYIDITCKDGSGGVYYDSVNSSWVFERWK